MHTLPLLVQMTVALGAAFCGGLIARRFRLPPIVGYLLAGVATGPFTPGFIGDVETITQLAELGVIFLLFGVGLHFSLRDLWAVRKIAIPGALGQMTFATLTGFALTRLWGWSGSAGVVLGLAISIASTVVLLRGLMDQGLLNTRHGQAAVGWLVLEDLATVLMLVFLPVLSPADQGTCGKTTFQAMVQEACEQLAPLREEEFKKQPVPVRHALGRLNQTLAQKQFRWAVVNRHNTGYLLSGRNLS